MGYEVKNKWLTSPFLPDPSNSSSFSSMKMGLLLLWSLFCCTFSAVESDNELCFDLCKLLFFNNEFQRIMWNDEANVLWFFSLQWFLLTSPNESWNYSEGYIQQKWKTIFLHFPITNECICVSVKRTFLLS